MTHTQPTSNPPSLAGSPVSRTIISLLAATVLLTALLIYSTIDNIHRAETHMLDFVREKGETIIQVLEAGSKTSARHMMGRGNPLHTLIEESSKAEDIVFIRLTAEDGTIVDQAGFSLPTSLSPESVATLLNTGETLVQSEPQHKTIIISRVFQVLRPPVNMHGHGVTTSPTGPSAPANRSVISIGIHTYEFEKVKQQDVKHAFFMGALLFLVGSAGIYLAFLYQRMRQAKSTIATMQLYLESIIESIPVGLVTVDSEKNIVSCNHNFEQLINCSEEQLTTKKLSEVLPQINLPTPGSANDHVEASAQLQQTNGNTIPLRVTCSLLVDQQRIPIGQVIIIRDMSSIQDMEVQLERSRRLAALGKMAAGIAHEIRNPLGTLKGFAQYFGKNSPTATGKEYADLMVSEVDRLNGIISALLQFARPQNPQFKNCSLQELFSRAYTLMGSELKAKGIAFRCSETPLGISADPDLLLQVLLNLLHNSVRVTAPGGEIALSAVKHDHGVRINVSDTGCGMTEQIRDQMFDPFFTTTKTGTGLGLAISHQIIEQHKGSFEVRTIKGQGTTVTIILPPGLEQN
jgi:two-component system sensor histidine kinase HydH